MTSGELMTGPRLTIAGRLPFGDGEVGRKFPLNGREEEAEYASNAERFILPVSHPFTADCVEDRRTIAWASGESRRAFIEARVAYKLTGGLVLATTKAAIGADAAYLRDAPDIRGAYILTLDQLAGGGFQESAHNNCGASSLVEKSVAKQLSRDHLLSALQSLTKVDSRTNFYLDKNQETKQRKLDAGFYSTWDPKWHESIVSLRFPQNFSHLDIDENDHETHGHNASGLVVVKKPGFSFANTAFTNETGRMAFSYTPDIIPKIIETISGNSEEEKARLALEFATDAANVFNLLVVEDFPVFATAA